MATPAPQLASSASVKAAPVVPKKMGFDPMRPVRYLTSFTHGSVIGTLDSMAKWGRKASFAGALGGGLLMIAGAPAVAGLGIATIFVGWAMGLAAGAVAGGVVGLATGGVCEMQRQRRGEVHADDLQQKAAARKLPIPRTDYREAHRDYQRRNNWLFDRVLQQEREIKQDTQTYFQDMVHNSRHHGPGHGRGW